MEKTYARNLFCMFLRRICMFAGDVIDGEAILFDVLKYSGILAWR